MGVWSSIGGSVIVEIVSPYPTDAISGLVSSGCEIENIEIVNDTVFRCRIRRSRYAHLCHYLQKKGGEVRTQKREKTFHKKQNTRFCEVNRHNLVIFTIYL